MSRLRSTQYRHHSFDVSPKVVVTVVEEAIQDRLNLALGEVAQPVHVETVGAALSVVRERAVGAVLLGKNAMTAEAASAVGRLSTACEGELIAVMNGWTADLSGTLLAFGRHGIRTAVDVSSRAGLTELRNLIARRDANLCKRVAKAFEPCLVGTSEEMRQFMRHVIRVAPLIRSSASLANSLGVRPSSLNSRFFRAELPSPKEYLTYTRLLFAVAILEAPNISAAKVARRLYYSSPQSFFRHVRLQLGMPLSEFRENHSFESLLQHVAHRAFAQHEAKLKWFNPLGTMSHHRQIGEPE